MSQKLTTERLLLRPVANEDLDNVYRGLSHPNVIQFYGVSFKSAEETKEQMQWYADIASEDTGRMFAICDKTDGTFMGVGGFYHWNKIHRRAEVGIWFLPEFWGKGYMEEVMEALYDLAFKKLDINRLEGFVETSNLQCVKALEKCGFYYEGTMREVEIKKEQPVSLAIYARLSSD
ncbi:MAG: GNAT family N-acetyltransferase [Cyclobacteriaceae bacterium]|nr:GNAT family N-acetyltransferase [Cyclobacteriaceae bacterium]